MTKHLKYFLEKDQAIASPTGDESSSKLAGVRRRNLAPLQSCSYPSSSAGLKANHHVTYSCWPWSPTHVG